MNHLPERLRSQDGFSLLEVVVSIALLSVILLSFFSFFTQAAQVSDRNADRFDAGQISQELLYAVQSGNYTADLTTQDLNQLYGTNQPAGTPYTLTLNNQVYYPVVLIEPRDAAPAAITVRIEIESGGERKDVFTTYGYK